VVRSAHIVESSSIALMSFITDPRRHLNTCPLFPRIATSKAGGWRPGVAIPDSWILTPGSSLDQGFLVAATLAGLGSAISTRAPSIMESDGSAITASFAAKLEVTSTVLP
jgi:hypothetical protein